MLALTQVQERKGGAEEKELCGTVLPLFWELSGGMHLQRYRDAVLHLFMASNLHRRWHRQGTSHTYRGGKRGHIKSCSCKPFTSRTRPCGLAKATDCLSPISLGCLATSFCLVRNSAFRLPIIIKPVAHTASQMGQTEGRDDSPLAFWRDKECAAEWENEEGKTVLEMEGSKRTEFVSMSLIWSLTGIRGLAERKETSERC